MIKILILTLLLLPLNTYSNPTSAEGDSLKKQLEAWFEFSKKVNLPDQKVKARTEIESALDWEGIATLCLGEKNTKKYQGKNFSEFKSLLKEVVSKTAFSRMDKFWEKGTIAEIDKIEIQNSKAHASAKFKSQGEIFSLDYYLTKKANRWVIDDVAFEDMKYSVNIREQIDAFLKEKSFGDLLAKLKKRRDELDK
jgi:ABC-type transporter MlaC component